MLNCRFIGTLFDPTSILFVHNDEEWETPLFSFHYVDGKIYYTAVIGEIKLEFFPDTVYSCVPNKRPGTAIYFGKMSPANGKNLG